MATAKIENPGGLIYQKIIDVLVDAGAVAKDQKNQEQKFNYRGIDQVLNAINPLLKKHRIAVIPTRVKEVNVERFENANKKIITTAQVVVEYTWIAEDGSTLTCEVVGEGRDFADKSLSKSTSVAFRTLLIQTFALPTDERDPDADYIEIDTPQQQKTPSKPAPAPNDVAGLKKEIAGFVGSPYGETIKAVLDSGTSYLKKQGLAKEQADWTENPGLLKKVLDYFKSGEVE